ncbi:MAG: hypothetical protein LBE20_02100 [Deltaproteobacteria bacterium]|jgi:hypothetical protein|nr:hypothetical protein [Deltaproteobacteria bacterium]
MKKLINKVTPYQRQPATFLKFSLVLWFGSLVQGYFVCEFFHALNKHNHLNYFVISKKVQKAKVTLYQKNESYLGLDILSNF